nr:DUF4838 domain-containing protein [Tepidiforma sp.]
MSGTIDPRGWTVTHDGSEAALAAALELRAGLLRLEAAALAGGGEGVIEVAEDASLAAGTARVGAEARRILLEGSDRRALLDGAAWLLERAGVLALRPGALTTAEGPGLAPGVYELRPPFAERTLILGCDGLHADWREWLRFASRNGLNGLFFHDTPPSRWGREPGARRPATREAAAADGRGWLFELWDAEGDAIRTEARALGLRLEFGGHHLSALVPRERFAEQPEWFPLRRGRRDGRFNLCTSSAGARAELRANAARFFARFAGADVYHLWADDLRGGGWCECGGCVRLSPSDQALRAANAAAEVLGGMAPGARLAHLAYHDTLARPGKVRPLENVDALWAPRARCYAHAIDDPGCQRNREHLQELERLIAWFGGPERVRVFEYYSDSILFKWMAPPHLEVVPADLRAYGRLGVRGVQDLAVTPRPWWGPTWHAWWFARCAREGGGNPETALSAFCGAAFGDAAEAFAAAFRELETACRLLLERGELEPRRGYDVLDYGDTPREGLRALAGRARDALNHFGAAARALPLGVGGEALAQTEEFAPTVAAGMHLAERVLAWDAALHGDREGSASHLALARLHLRALTDWYHAHASPAFGNLGEGMLDAARRRMDEIAALAGLTAG